MTVHSNEFGMQFDRRLLNGALIGGRWEPGSGGTFAANDPHTGKRLHDIGRCAPSDVDRAVAAAKDAFTDWSKTSVQVRAKILRNMQRLFRDRAEAMAQMVTKEVGKPILAAREETFEYSGPAWGKAAEEILRYRGMTLPSTQEKTTNKRLVLGHRPLGVIGVITPFNFPTDISSIALAHAVAAGNTVVWKPTEYGPVSCAMVAELFEEAGFPPGVLNMVQGFGDVGAHLVRHADVKGIFFTGSNRVGEEIARVNPLRPMLLELGGDGPQIVLEDADIDRAVEGAITGAFYYSGQVCTSSERLFVHEKVYDEFLAKFRAATAALKIGDPADAGNDMGPLCNPAVLERARQHVADLREAGATIEQFGPEQGLYYPATIVTGLDRKMIRGKGESFSPLALVLKVASDEEAIEIANESELGLVASLWTQDMSKAWRVAEALPHGAVNVNETSNYWDQLAPFGGAGKSGVGRELSQWFLDSFTENKLIVFDLGGPADDRRIEGGW
ncbi:aldehyde dehydrogenase family protein [Shinella zoogloeoides]|uniref:aldehyde dehydrogenase family protein n=1 Tax=Shinella zoogloeoides TaxID=352475 RepID=UPI00299DA7D1|nr:aldehyde dehydrogenase family protein [Shinella zoogloeoides]WPE21454.1 Glutarate-semialdehyde dehydrogenase [Shinella zoogloeoides]